MADSTMVNGVLAQAGNARRSNITFVASLRAVIHYPNRSQPPHSAIDAVIAADVRAAVNRPRSQDEAG